MYIGIDFSMNSSGICIRDGVNVQFAAFPRGANLNKFPWTEIPIDVCNNVETKSFETYSEGEGKKLVDAINLSKLIGAYLVKRVHNTEETRIGLEGISYGSKGSSTLDIVGYQWILRREIYTSLGIVPEIYAPSTVKKHAGSGRFKKEQMIEKFFEQEHLSGTPFYDWAMKLREDGKKMCKPIDDLIDGYWLTVALEKTSVK